MEETGVEIIDNWGYWVFLRKKAAEGEFELYTDVDSQIEHYTKIRNMFKVVSIIELICFIVEIICFHQSNEPVLIFCVILIGVLVFVCIKATFKTNRTIAELKERISDYRRGEKSFRRRIKSFGRISNKRSMYERGKII